MAIAEDASLLAAGQSGPQNDGFGAKYNLLDKNGSTEPDRQDVLSVLAAPKPMRTLSSPTVSSEALKRQRDELGAPSNTSATVDKNIGGKAACMFVDDCDTGSQLRKAISHLFGRNKTCTLKIPEMVWVYYCRKHYQRVRYRNAKTYPITQMELVQTQIERLKAWSDRNRATGKGPYINSWTLSLRKREEKRLQGDGRRSEKGKEPYEVGAGHIPAWIIEELGEGFDTERMFKIAGRLHEEIMSGALTQVPEIEFLPDIVGDDKDKETTKSTRQRRQNSSTCVTRTSKRKATTDFHAMTQPSPAYHDMDYAGHGQDGEYDAEGAVSTSGKRPRTSRAASFLDGPSNSYTTASYFPARAENVVPKIQPTNYEHSRYAHNVGSGRLGHTHPVQSHARAASYSSVPPESEYASEPYYRPQKPPGYGQVPLHFSGSQSSASPPPMLPSITRQMHNASISYERHESAPRGARPQTRRPSRPMHQRSTSAFNPGRRCVPMSSRPSSSGNGEAVGHARYEMNRQVPPPAMYGPGHHGPQSSTEGDWRHHQYRGRPTWTSNYTHPAPSLPSNHTQYSNPHDPSYGSPFPRENDSS
ncbi:ORP1 like protein [Metarhizium album ARSEF 1941]|uniref:ORP1 like protein n=1 Tax=Metarhizium album (strain ARSEF 1941) TaxID=1081103 RepID=A0A0B2WVQ2_METAS|nr:ORP1 like protein [Metarhizium album ARSEF 1941]KHN96985.1 ORP1 like protein [Metarhizium album ARSEF 1941]